MLTVHVNISIRLLDFKQLNMLKHQQKNFYYCCPSRVYDRKWRVYIDSFKITCCVAGSQKVARDKDNKKKWVHMRKK